MPGTHSLFVDTDAVNLVVSTLLKACIKKRNGSNWASKRNLALPTYRIPNLHFDSDLQFALKSRGFFQGTKTIPLQLKTKPEKGFVNTESKPT